MAEEELQDSGWRGAGQAQSCGGALGFPTLPPCRMEALWWGQWVPSSGGLGPACLLKAPSRETRESGLRPGCPGQLVLVSSKLCLSRALGLSLSSL